MVPSARDMTDLLKELTRSSITCSNRHEARSSSWKEYTFPENDAALGRGAFGTVMKVTHNGRSLGFAD